MRLRPTALWGTCACVLVMLVGPGGVARDASGGLSTEFGEVRLQHLAIGKTYSVVRLAEAPLVIRNTSEDTLHVFVEVEIPARHELRDHALPLPSLRWVRLENARFRLPAGTTRRTDVRVSLPYDPELAGKTFQVNFRSHMVDESGNTLGVERVHRLLFTVEMDYRDDTEARFTSLQPRAVRRDR